MPEINHKDQPSIPVPASTPKAAPEVTAQKLAAAIANAGVSNSDLEKQIEAILNKKKAEAKAAMAPKEPNWSEISEQDAYNSDVYIPVIDHDIPDYMNMKLKDGEYDVVWASRDQRRLGQLTAEGYEFLKAEHVHPSFKLPLPFNGEGHYIYQDVIAMRVHKRILYGKRRRALEMSKNQLKRRGADARIKAKLAEIIEGDPSLEMAFQKQGFGFYDTSDAI